MEQELRAVSVCVITSLLFTTLNVKAEGNSTLTPYYNDTFVIPQPIFFMLYPKGFSLTISEKPWMKSVQAFGVIRQRIYGSLYNPLDIFGTFFNKLTLLKNRFFECENLNVPIDHDEWCEIALVITTFDGNYYRVLNESYTFEVQQ